MEIGSLVRVKKVSEQESDYYRWSRNKWICIFLLPSRSLPPAPHLQTFHINFTIKIVEEKRKNLRHRRNAEIIIYCGFIKFFFRFHFFLLSSLSRVGRQGGSRGEPDECNLNTSAIKNMNNFLYSSACRFIWLYLKAGSLREFKWNFFGIELENIFESLMTVEKN